MTLNIKCKAALDNEPGGKGLASSACTWPASSPPGIWPQFSSHSSSGKQVSKHRNSAKLPWHHNTERSLFLSLSFWHFVILSFCLYFLFCHFVILTFCLFYLFVLTSLWSNVWRVSSTLLFVQILKRHTVKSHLSIIPEYLNGQRWRSWSRSNFLKNLSCWLLHYRSCILVRDFEWFSLVDRRSMIGVGKDVKKDEANYGWWQNSLSCKWGREKHFVKQKKWQKKWWCFAIKRQTALGESLLCEIGLFLCTCTQQSTDSCFHFHLSRCASIS